MSYKSRIPEIIAALEPRLDVIARMTAELVEQRAKERVAVASGLLQERIHIEHEKPGEYLVVAGDTEAFYGHIVEHGGAHTPARPFMVPAVEETRGDVAKIAAPIMGRL